MLPIAAHKHQSNYFTDLTCHQRSHPPKEEEEEEEEEKGGGEVEEVWK
jgi:hypothetical protein